MHIFTRSSVEYWYVSQCGQCIYYNIISPHLWWGLTWWNLKKKFFLYLNTLFPLLKKNTTKKKLKLQFQNQQQILDDTRSPKCSFFYFVGTLPGVPLLQIDFILLYCNRCIRLTGTSILRHIQVLETCIYRFRCWSDRIIRTPPNLAFWVSEKNFENLKPANPSHWKRLVAKTLW